MVHVVKTTTQEDPDSELCLTVGAIHPCFLAHVLVCGNTLPLQTHLLPEHILSITTTVYMYKYMIPSCWNHCDRIIWWLPVRSDISTWTRFCMRIALLLLPYGCLIQKFYSTCELMHSLRPDRMGNDMKHLCVPISILLTMTVLHISHKIKVTKWTILKWMHTPYAVSSRLAPQLKTYNLPTVE